MLTTLLTTGYTTLPPVNTSDYCHDQRYTCSTEIWNHQEVTC